MPDRNRPLSQGKIAALERLKLAYDDAHDAGEEPARFAATKDELIAGGATSSDLLWLLRLRFVEHVREVTRDGGPRRQFREANGPVLEPNSCFFLTYGGNVYVERNGLHRRAADRPASRGAAKRKANGGGKTRRDGTAANRGGKRRATNSRVSHRGAVRRQPEIPSWNADEGNLYWRGRVILHLAAWASAEREILDEFEAWRWESPIPNPIPRGAAGDPARARRNAVYNLNRRLGANPQLEFFCLKGFSLGWCPSAHRRGQT